MRRLPRQAFCPAFVANLTLPWACIRLTAGLPARAAVLWTALLPATSGVFWTLMFEFSYACSGFDAWAAAVALVVTAGMQATRANRLVAAAENSAAGDQR